jgi:hypothetical protein
MPLTLAGYAPLPGAPGAYVPQRQRRRQEDTGVAARSLANIDPTVPVMVDPQ